MEQFSFSSQTRKNQYIKSTKKINLNIDLHGFFLSRLIYFFTLLVSYRKLKNLLIKNQPNFLIVHLLTYIRFFNLSK